MTHQSSSPATAAALIARADKYLNTGSGEYASEIMRDMAEFIRASQLATPTGGEAEPVAWELVESDGTFALTKDPAIAQSWRDAGDNVRPLYADPQHAPSSAGIAGAAEAPRHPEGCACDRCEGRPLSRSAHRGAAEASDPGTFAGVVVRRLNNLITTADPGITWEKEASDEMARAIQLIERLHTGDLAQAVPDGFVLVPREPTPAMISAGMGKIPEDSSEFEDVEAAYRAMVAAAVSSTGGK